MRELASRFRGSMLGWLWALASPLVMMAAYTVIFSGVLSVPNAQANHTKGSLSLVIFSGIILFNLFAELLYRSPGLIHEHAGFIKKSIFPTETLAWIAVFRALVYASISFGVLLVFQLVLTWHIPWTVIFVPFVVVPFVLLLLGAVWFLMALGAFTRDIVHLMASIVPVMMFITPVFYTFSQVPERLRPWVRLNILGDYIDMFRNVSVFGQLPSPILYLTCAAVSVVVFRLGYAFFMRYKAVFADVI